MTVAQSILMLIVFAAGLAGGGLSVYFILARRADRPDLLTAAFAKEAAVSAARERQTFLDLAGEKLAPLSADLRRLESHVSEVEKERTRSHSSIETMLKTLSEQHKDVAEIGRQVSGQTSALVAALRNPTTRGRWGEVQLRRVVELAGMSSYCDFDEQTGSSEGRPDLTVRLPGDRVAYVDAKTPLAAYLQMMEEPDPQRQAILRTEHAKAVKSHIDALSKKDYHAAGSSVEFTVMFVPGEAFLQCALIESPNLLEYAMEHHIFLCGPMSLMPVLYSYALSWRERTQEARSKEIAQLGAELYDRLRIFIDHFAGIGAAFSKAVACYNQAAGSLESRLLPHGRRIKEAAALPDEDISRPEIVDVEPRQLTRAE